MSFDRVNPSTERPSDRTGATRDNGAAITEPTSPALRLQILSTEHWSLLASRSLAWNEAFSRAGMFLTTLSGATVALALVAQASAFGDAFFLFALVILPIALFVGISTFLRLGASNEHDALCVAGMNRIRGAYLELAPELAPYFVMSAHDDPRGVGVTMGLRPGKTTIGHFVAGTPNLLIVLNSLLAGVITALLIFQFNPPTAVAVVSGAAAFFVAMTLHFWYVIQLIRHGQTSLRPLFPTPRDRLA